MSELGDKIRGLKRKDPTTYADMQWDFALDRAAALADEHAATIAAAYEAAADTAIQHISKIQVNEPLWHEGQDWAADRISQAIRALAATDPDGSAALNRIKAEARLEGMREAYELCKGVRRGAETDDYGIGALDCAIAILAAAEKEAGNG